MTKAALAKWQAANGVNNTGYTAPIVINGAGVATNFGAIGNSGAILSWTGLNNIQLGTNAAIGSDGNRFDIPDLRELPLASQALLLAHL